MATRWNDVLGTIRVKTPDRSFDLMINQWLLYQTLACRVLARTCASISLVGHIRFRGSIAGRHGAGDADAGYGQRASLRPPRISSKKGTFSIGGTSPPARGRNPHLR